MLRFGQVHAPTLRLVTHEALGVRAVEAIFAFGRQLGGIRDIAFMGEEQEDLLAADDTTDVPAITRSGHVSAALSLIQGQSCPIPLHASRR